MAAVARRGPLRFAPRRGTLEPEVEHQRFHNVSNAHPEPTGAPRAEDSNRDAVQFLVYLVAAASAGIAFFGLMAEFGKNAQPAPPNVPVEIKTTDLLPKLPKLEALGPNEPVPKGLKYVPLNERRD